MYFIDVDRTEEHWTSDMFDFLGTVDSRVFVNIVDLMFIDVVGDDFN